MEEEEKESRNRPGVLQTVPGGLGSQISRHSAREGGEVVSLTHRPPLHLGMFLVLIFIRGWVDPRAMVRSERRHELTDIPYHVKVLFIVILPRRVPQSRGERLPRRDEFKDHKYVYCLTSRPPPDVSPRTSHHKKVFADQNTLCPSCSTTLTPCFSRLKGF